MPVTNRPSATRVSPIRSSLFGGDDQPAVVSTHLATGKWRGAIFPNGSTQQRCSDR